MIRNIHFGPPVCCSVYIQPLSFDLARTRAMLSSIRLRPGLYAATIALSAALLFVIEPVAAKALLPEFGGSAGVWIACVLFFQVTLLLGYLYAYVLTRRLPAKAQAAIHIALLAASAFVLPWNPPVAQAGGNPSLAILSVLAASLGLPFFALCTTSPLLQSWYSNSGQARFPYRLFALSNAASLVALLAYPVGIEPMFTLHRQFLGWSVGFLIFAALAGVCALGARGAATTADQKMPHRPLLWIALAACAATLWPAVVNHLSQEVAAIPFLWVEPLSIYLLTFILCFEGRGWYNPRLYRVLLPLACLTFVWRLQSAGGGIVWELPAVGAALFVCCMFCHGELARLKPEPRQGLAFFYLMVALGGALGAVFVGLFAPNVFSSYLELPVGVAACFVLSLPLLYGRTSPRQLLRLALVAALAFAAASRFAGGRDDLVRTRNFYGTLRIADAGSGDDKIRSLFNGKVLHGIQYLTPVRSRIATAYYAPESGVGQAMRWLRLQKPWRVGVVGLGTGTLAVYARPGDSFRFYDVNPAVIAVAWRYFHFLSESAAKVETVEADGRLGLAREPAHSLNMIALDAFSGDSIPVHLLTREAFQMYFHQLAPGGVVAIHVTNRYLDIASVVGALAADLRKQLVIIRNPPDEPRHVQAADWAILADRREDLASLEPFNDSSVRPRKAPVWTDDYSNLFEILR
jgi:SAM-dependent methyltransferase